MYIDSNEEKWWGRQPVKKVQLYCLIQMGLSMRIGEKRCGGEHDKRSRGSWWK